MRNRVNTDETVAAVAIADSRCETWTVREGALSADPADPQAHSGLAYKAAGRARHVITTYIVPNAAVL